MRSRWLSRRALAAHAAVVVWVPGCAVAAWWQVTVALGGDHLAYLYSVEWPCFAVFGVVAWWNFVHDDPDALGARALRRVRRVAGTPLDDPLATDARIASYEAEDPELAAYNDYLARLAASDTEVGGRAPARQRR